MSAYRKLLFPAALVLVPFAFSSAGDRPTDAEARYQIKYGRSYPSTERQKMDAAKHKKTDEVVASNRKDTKESEKKSSEGKTDTDRAAVGN